MKQGPPGGSEAVRLRMLMTLGVVLCIIGAFLLLGAVITAGISTSFGYGGGDGLVEQPWFGVLSSLAVGAIGVAAVVAGVRGRRHPPPRPDRH